VLTPCIIFTSLLPAVALFGGRWARAVTARRSLDAVAAALETEYPKEVKAWGGSPVLRDEATLRELLRQLGKR